MILFAALTRLKTRRYIYKEARASDPELALAEAV